MSLSRDSGSTQVYSVLIDNSGNVRRWDIFNSTRLIPWSQFQHDAANTGRSPTSRTRFDFDGDGKTDTSIFRPSVGEWWFLRSSDGGNYATQFGNLPIN